MDESGTYSRMVNIFVSSIMLILLICTFCHGQTTIHGTVVDADHHPIEFANVYIKNKPLGTMTDNRGKFYLELSDGQVKSDKDSIIISHIGYVNVIKSLTAVVPNEQFVLSSAKAYELETVSVPGITAKESIFAGAAQKKTDQFFRNNLYKSYQIATLINTGVTH